MVRIIKKSGVFNTIFASLFIILGIVVLVRLVLNAELVIGFLTLVFGLVAIIWTVRAMNALSPGSSLKNYTTHFLLCLIFLLLSTLWNTIEKLFLLKENFGPIMVYPGYIFLIFSYLVFVSAAYKILYLGKEFGFQEQAKRIKKAVKKH